MERSLLKLLLKTRTDVLELVRNIDDSRYLGDGTNTNFSTKLRIEEMYSTYFAELQQFGLLVVKRHCHCSNPKHYDYPGEYPVENSYGLEISYPYEDHFLIRDQLSQGHENAICPCDENNQPTQHNVIKDILLTSDANIKVCEGLEAILHCLFEAKTRAGSNRPRAAIREQLLWAILNLNDMLLPEPMHEYVAKLRQ